MTDVRRCYRCSDPLKEGNWCKSCKVWTWESHSRVHTAIKYWEDLSDKPLARMSLGMMDHVLCGGVVKSDIVLIAGGPGDGKSTLLLEVCERIWQHGTALYIHSEEDDLTIKARGKRLGMKPKARQLAFCNAMGGGADIGQVLIDVKPAGFIVDSLNGLVSGDIGEEIHALEIIKMFCVQMQCPAIVISQVNSEHEMNGLMAKRHAVDVLLRLSKDPEVTTENGEPVRLLESSDKNRNGRIGLKTWLEMGEKGLRKLDDDECTSLGLTDE